MADKLGISAFDQIGTPPREERVSLKDIRVMLEARVEGYRNLFVYLLSVKLMTREQEGDSGKK